MTARADCICLKDIRRRCVNCRVLPMSEHDVACTFCEPDSPAVSGDVLPGQTRFFQGDDEDDLLFQVMGEHGGFEEFRR